MGREEQGIKCRKCGVSGFDEKGIGPHESKCTGDAARTRALQRRRDRYKRRVEEAENHTNNGTTASLRGRKQVQHCGVDLTRLSWEQLVALESERYGELMHRFKQATHKRAKA